MKKNHFYIATLMWLSSMSGMQAQQVPTHNHDADALIPCRAHEQMRAYYRANPKALEEANHPNRTISKAERPSEYTLPVVFHIFGDDFFGRKITDEIIIDALRKTNEDFQGLTANWGDDDPTFDKIKKELKITFKLAQKDPNGNATTGILYHPVEKGFGNYWNDRMGLYSWDNYSYMNIYVMIDLYGDGVTNNSGVSWYPDKQMADQNLARVVYNPLYIGTNTDENFRRVLTHEFGHFLNLAHTFDYDDNLFSDGCNDAADGTLNPGDYVDDTPPANKMLMKANDLNCHEEKTNWTNFMNYTDRYSMFTIGQVDRMLDGLDHEARVTLWSKENLDKVFFAEATPRISVSKDAITEATENDGSFAEAYKFTVLDASVESGKAYTNGTEFTIENLPAGLTARLVSTSASTLSLYLDGKATAHTSEKNIENLTLTINNSILTSGKLYKNKFILKANFRDPYQIVYVDYDDVNISASNNWQFLKLADNFASSEFGMMYENRKLRIETYKKALVCEGETRNISFISFGEAIGSKSNWVEGGDYPNLHDLFTANHKTWKGRIGFVGFQFQGDNKNEIIYGWMKIAVSEDGKSFTLKDYAYNQAPNTDILAGQKDGNPLKPELIFSSNAIHEDALLNDGTISQTINFEVLGDNSFNKTGVLSNETDYVLGKVPAGLTAKIEVITPQKAVLSFSGKATDHEGNFGTNTKLEFKSTIFTNSEISNLKQNLDYIFLYKYQIVTETVDYYAGPGSAWQYFTFPLIDAKFGAWEFSSGFLKIQTYGKPAICVEETNNFLPLEAETEIGPNSKWTTPKDQYEGVFNLKRVNWAGKTAYIGISMPFAGNTLYGWMKVSVDEEGKSFRITQWAYNENPGQAIRAGQQEMVGIESMNAELKEVSVYPNPVSEELYIQAPEQSQLTLYSINGSLVWQGEATSNQTKIYIKGFDRGVYFIHVLKEGEKAIRKIIIL